MADILLIDDNFSLLKIQTEFLRHAGHHVTTAANGKLGLAAALSREFDVVITDLIMPETEGIDVIVQLRKKYPKLKMIAISGGGRDGPECRLTLAHKLGAAVTLEKPFSGWTLIAIVNDLLAGNEPTQAKAIVGSFV